MSQDAVTQLEISGAPFLQKLLPDHSGPTPSTPGTKSGFVPLPGTDQQQSPLHASICSSPFPASLQWAHPAHPSLTHPSECQSLPFLPKTSHLPFYPFPPTAAASKLCCKGGEGGKRGGTEITTAAGPGCPCPLPLCSVHKHAHREQQSMPGPSTSPTPAAPCAGAGAARSSRAAFCSLQSCPCGKAQQQGQKHPMSYVLNYGE